MINMGPKNIGRSEGLVPTSTVLYIASMPRCFAQKADDSNVRNFIQSERPRSVLLVMIPKSRHRFLQLSPELTGRLVEMIMAKLRLGSSKCLLLVAFSLEHHNF